MSRLKVGSASSPGRKAPLGRTTRHTKMHATCRTLHPALGVAPRACTSATLSAASSPGSSSRVPAVVPARRLALAAAENARRGGAVVAHARRGGGAGTAGKATRGGKGRVKASPGKDKGAKTGGGAVSKAKKAAKQQVRVLPVSRQSSRAVARRTLSETASEPLASRRARLTFSPRSPSRRPSGMGRRVVSRRHG